MDTERDDTIQTLVRHAAFPDGAGFIDCACGHRNTLTLSEHAAHVADALLT